jgi:hypothetical protein
MKHVGMRRAVEWMRKARTHGGPDYSNGGMFWDGPDFKTNPQNWKRKSGFKYSHPSHDIFKVPAKIELKIEPWWIKDPKTGKRVASTERGRYDSVYISTAAHGQTIFWRINPDWAKATGGRTH